MDVRPHLWIILYISWSKPLGAKAQALQNIYYMCPEMERDIVKCGDEFRIHQDDITTYPVNLIAASEEKQKRICRTGEIMSAAKCIEGAIDQADCGDMEFETGSSLKQIMKFNGTTSAAARLCNSIGTKYNLQAVGCFGGAYKYITGDCITAHGPAMEAEAKRKIENAVEDQEILEIYLCLSYHIYKWCTEVAMDTCPEARDYAMEVQRLITPPACQKFYFDLIKVGRSTSQAAQMQPRGCLFLFVVYFILFYLYVFSFDIARVH